MSEPKTVPKLGRKRIGEKNVRKCLNLSLSQETRRRLLASAKSRGMAAGRIIDELFAASEPA